MAKWPTANPGQTAKVPTLDKMLEKIKFWMIQGKIGISTQYNLLVALFPDKIINKKDLSNAIQRFKKQAKPSKNDACQMLTKLYLKKRR